MEPVTKLHTRESLRPVLRSLQGDGLRIVFTNGCFDILHAGHVRYLRAARREGDRLVLGVNSDRSVHSIKGPRRPIVPLEQRAEVLSALEFVDFIVPFDEPDPAMLIDWLQPDILVKGADWPEDRIVGARRVKARGGRVVRIPVVPEISTSAIIAAILQRYGKNGRN